MSALVLDAGAFIAVERNSRAMAARLRLAHEHDLGLRSSAIVIAQVWRDPSGSQARLARLLHAVDVRPVDERMGRDAGILLGRARTRDPIDATVALIAEAGDRIITSDPDDMRRLVAAARTRAAVIAC